MTLRVAKCGCLLHPGQRCATHAAAEIRADEQRRTERRRQSGRNTQAWQATRRRVLERDANTCVKCGRPGRQVHRLAGGYHHTGVGRDDEYVTLCDHCHQGHHAALRRRVNGGRGPSKRV